MYNSLITASTNYNYNTLYQRSYTQNSLHPTTHAYQPSAYYNLKTFDDRLNVELYRNTQTIPEHRSPLATIIGQENFDINYHSYLPHENITEKPLIKTLKHSNSLNYLSNNALLSTFQSAPFINSNKNPKLSNTPYRNTYEKNKLSAGKYQIGHESKLGKKKITDEYSETLAHNDLEEKHYFDIESKSMHLLSGDYNNFNEKFSNLNQTCCDKKQEYSSIISNNNWGPSTNQIKHHQNWNYTNLNTKQNHSPMSSPKSSKILFTKSSSVKLFKKRNSESSVEGSAATPVNHAVQKRSSFCVAVTEPRHVDLCVIKAEPKLADFKIGKLLGKGNFGQVYVAEHIKTGFLCAMKMIPKQKIIEDKIQSQVIRELKLHSFLRHKNIIEQYGFFSDAENLYIIIQLCPEGQLYSIIKRKKRLTEATTAFIIKQLCEGLLYLHDNRIIHRDIKPENIILNNGMIKICDFGWAVNCADGMRGTLCGTPLYLSPEMIRGQQYDESVDIWAVGVLTYELLVGSMPFKIWREGELGKIVSDEVKFPSYIDVTDSAKDFILKIMEKNPVNRVEIEALLHHPFLKQAHQTPEYLAQLQ